jgi:3-oxoadipate enol-lactonase
MDGMQISQTANGLQVESIDLRAPWEPQRPAIVMHHGIGTTAAIWSGWLPLLAPHYRIVRFDTRGFGRSAHAWRDGPTMAALVDDLLAVADLAGEDKVHLLGESLGGTVALAAALARPDRIASVTASNATHRGTGIARVRGWREEFARNGIAGWAADMMPARFTDDAPLSPEARAWFDRTQAGSNADAILQLGALLAGLDMSAEVRRITQPLLVLSPDGSPFISTAMAAELQALVPGAELCIFPNTRHGLPFSHGEACAREMLRFLMTRFG